MFDRVGKKMCTHNLLSNFTLKTGGFIPDRDILRGTDVPQHAEATKLVRETDTFTEKQRFTENTITYSLEMGVGFKT